MSTKLLIDNRFLVVHPRTALWAVQRLDCANCRHLIQGDTAMRCAQLKIEFNGGRRHTGEHGYCIDAREPGAVCGPEARLHSPA